MSTTRTRIRAGPWPGWLRWWYAQGGPARDAAIWHAYLAQVSAGNLRPGQLVADQMGVSRSTVHRAITRHGQRLRGEWPPEISNGFGESYATRRARRLRQLDQRGDLDAPEDLDLGQSPA